MRGEKSSSLYSKEGVIILRTWPIIRSNILISTEKWSHCCWPQRTWYGGRDPRLMYTTGCGSGGRGKRGLAPVCRRLFGHILTPWLPYILFRPREYLFTLGRGCCRVWYDEEGDQSKKWQIRRLREAAAASILWEMMLTLHCFLTSPATRGITCYTLYPLLFEGLTKIDHLNTAASLHDGARIGAGWLGGFIIYNLHNMPMGNSLLLHQ